MNLNLSVKHLRAFAQLAAERSFTRAAQNCYLSQPAFSMLIRNLEDQVGAPLFSRNTRNVALTDEGRMFEARVMPLLREFEDVFSGIHGHVERHRKRLAIAALPTIAGGALVPVLTAFRDQHPDVAVALRDVQADYCLDLVRERQVDFALTAASAPGPDLTSQPLASDSIHLVCRSDHPLSRRRQLALADVAPLPMICFERSSSIRQYVDAAFYPHHVAPLMEVCQLVTAVGLVAAGLGVTLVPTMALFPFQIPALVAIPVRLPIQDRRICLIRRRDGVDSTAARASVELLVQAWRAPAKARQRQRM